MRSKMTTITLKKVQYDRLVNFQREISREMPWIGDLSLGSFIDFLVTMSRVDFSLARRNHKPNKEAREMAAAILGHGISTAMQTLRDNYAKTKTKPAGVATF